MKINIKKGKYKSIDEVEIEIVRSVPQPEVVEVSVYSVKRIKKEIEECVEKIERLKIRKTDLEKVLNENEKEIIDSVL